MICCIFPWNNINHLKNMRSIQRFFFLLWIIFQYVRLFQILLKTKDFVRSVATWTWNTTFLTRLILITLIIQLYTIFRVNYGTLYKDNNGNENIQIFSSFFFLQFLWLISTIFIFTSLYPLFCSMSSFILTSSGISLLYTNNNNCDCSPR